MAMDKWYLIIGWIPSSLAVAGNALVIHLVITRRRLLTTVLNRFLVSLAVADFCVGALIYPGHAICHSMPTWCNREIRDNISVMVIYASVTNLCAITLDRYIAIAKPLRYKSLMTAGRASRIAAAAWLAPLWFFFIPSLCVSLKLFPIRAEVSNIIWTSLFEFSPCAFLLLTSTRAVVTARGHIRRESHMSIQLRLNRPQLKQRRRGSSIKVTITIVGIFLLCYTVEVYSSFCFFTDLCTMTENLIDLVWFLIITNSAANPIAYAFLKRDIQRELRSFLFGKSRKAEQTLSRFRTSRV